MLWLLRTRPASIRRACGLHALLASLLIAAGAYAQSGTADQTAPIGTTPEQVDPAPEAAVTGTPPHRLPVETYSVPATGTASSQAPTMAPAPHETGAMMAQSPTPDAAAPSNQTPPAAQSSSAETAVPRLRPPARGILYRIVPPPAVAPGPTTGISAPDAAPAPQVRTISYLFGTIHFGDDAVLGLTSELLGATLAQATTLVNEIDPASANDEAVDRIRWLAPGQTLSAMISADSFAMARSMLKIPASTLERMKPWAVLALLESQAGVMDSTVDDRLQRMADERGMRVVHLESAEEQLHALDCVPSETLALVLDERLKAPWIVREMSQRALVHYRNRDLDAWLADIDRMLGLGAKGKVIETRARRCLIEERNRRWLPKLLALIEEGGCYVAVGALHLPGENGLLATLARAGYSIEAQPL